MPDSRTLNLLCECKLSDLLHSDDQSPRWEASGVLVKDGQYFVVFDDRTEIARVAADLQAGNGNGLCGMAHTVTGYEGITYNTTKQRFYLLVEARKHSKGRYQAVIVEYDNDFQYLKERPLDFTFKSDNKGFEAVASVRHGEQDCLLALCEGNECKCGQKGRQPGGGRVQVFLKKRKRWEHAHTIALPASLPFADYSGMSLDGSRIAIVSQMSSMLWVGQFNETEWTWRDAGQLYEFPRLDDCSIRYGNIEGVGWVTPTRVVTVSDRRKRSGQPDDRLTETDQSIQIFEIPA
jgi:hypothetical protein